MTSFGTSSHRHPARTVGLGALFLVHALWLSGLAEDAFISYRFAHHLAHGHGLVWNLGEAPVEGFTNLLWVLVAAAAEWLGAAPERITVALGVAAGLGTLAAADRLAARGLGLGSGARGLAATLLAVSGPLAAWSMSGLETVPFTFLVYAALALLQDRASHGSPRTLVAGWSLVALATLARPEGALLAGLSGALALVSTRGAERRSRLLAAAGYGVFLIAVTGFRWFYFGALLPNTFYAKTGGGLEQIERGALYAGYFALHFMLPLVPLALLGMTRARPAADPGRSPATLALAGWALGMGAYIVAVGGDYMAMDRFFVPVIPALVLLVAQRVDPLLRAARLGGPVRRAAALAAALGILGTAIQSTPLERHLFAKAPLQHGTYRGVETERWHVARLALLARFFAERAAGHPNASIATGAIGVIGDRTDLAVYDFHGLVDPAIAHGSASRKPLGTGLPGHEKSDWKRSLDRRPTFWMFTRALRAESADWPRYDAETDRRLRAEYELVTVELEDRENRERGKFSFLERKDFSGN